MNQDYRIKYKHLFRDKSPIKNIMSSLTDDINHILKDFNSSVKSVFYAENRVLIPGEGRALPRHGIIIEHCGNNEDFNRDFNNYIEPINILAKKLDSKTTIYEYSFEKEFTDKNKWVLYNKHYVAYNLSL